MCICTRVEINSAQRLVTYLFMINSVNRSRVAPVIAAAAIAARTITLITRISGSPYSRCLQIALFLRVALPLCAPPPPRPTVAKLRRQL